MGIIYQKRIGKEKGTGLNISKSGISASYRGKYGSFGSSGFTIKTGIPGLYFRKYSSKNKGITTLIIIAFYALYAIFYFQALVIYNLILLTIWIFKILFQITFLSISFIYQKLFIKRQLAQK